MKERIPLPIDPKLPEVLGALASGRNLVLQAAPGTGKTTRVPPALLGAPFRKGGEILVLEPRRLAAKLAARRVASELGEQVGKTVGYHFRFEKVSSPETRLLFLTEGMLMRRLLGDPELKGVAAVVLDEFHERHLHGDLALSHLRRLQKSSRDDLRLIVMSATLDAGPIAQFLGGCPVLEAPGKQYEVETTYLAQPSTKRLDELVRDSVKRALELEDSGDILVFLPGMADIRRAQSALEQSFSPKELLVAPLHGELTREEQDLAIEKAGRPKVILSTNVAETSLTIEGVRTVIDSGLHRQASHSWWSGVPALKTKPISRASAIQRAGRAGRQAPGRAFRLYTKGDYDGRAAFEAPEIRRADLAQTLLELKALGVGDLSGYEWFETPAETQVSAALELLLKLGALEPSATPASSRLTAIGKKLAELPAHPRLGRMLLAAEGGAALEDAATLAALIQEGRLEGLDALSQLRSARSDDSIKKARTQLLGALGRGGGKVSKGASLEVSLLSGFPDRVGRMRKGELLLSSGGSAKFEGVSGEFFVVLDLQEKQGHKQARSWLEVRSVCPIQEEWLFDVEPPIVKEEEKLSWDSERKKVLAVSSLICGAIVLAEDKKPPADLEAAARVLIRDGLGVSAERLTKLEPAQLVLALSSVAEPEELERTLARMDLLRRHFPDLGLPALDSTALADLLLRLVEGKMGIEELKEADPAQGIISLLPPDAQARIDRLLPREITLPGGRKPKVQYKLGQAPWIESRLQDFFGMKQGPSLLDGRLPLTLHLLAPNYRAVQVTTDLAGFWQRAYREVRRELSRNYPRHSWPENPLEAEPPKPRERKP